MFFLRKKKRLALYLVNSLQEKIDKDLSVMLLDYFINKKEEVLFSDLFSSLVNNMECRENYLQLINILVRYQEKMGRKRRKKSY